LGCFKYKENSAKISVEFDICKKMENKSYLFFFFLIYGIEVIPKKMDHYMGCYMYRFEKNKWKRRRDNPSKGNPPNH